MSSNAKKEEPEKNDENRGGKLKGPEAPLYNAISPMFYTLKFFGFAPYKFDGDELVPSMPSLGITIVALLFYTFIFVTFCSRFSFSVFNVNESAILITTERGKVVLNYFVLTFSLIECIRKRVEFTTTWNKIADFDECLRKKGYVRSESSIKIRMWLVVCYNILVWFSVNQSGMFAFLEPWYKNVSYMLLYVCTAAALIKYTGIVFCLGQRFTFLNKIAGLNEAVFYKDESQLEKDTKWIEVMYSELMTISEHFISNHTWSLFIWIFNLGIHSVSNTYYVLEFSTSSEILFPYYFIWCLTSWLFAYISQIVLVHSCCHYASNEANMMGYLLLDRRRCLAISGYYQVENLQSTLHLLNRKLKFLAAGCFDVNLPLLQSMIKVTVMYLVILLQLPDDRNVVHRPSKKG